MDINSILESYNIIWHSQSRNSSESMPVGGGDIGLNVWVEDNELFFYIGKSDTFDENNQILKPGRVRVKLEPNPFCKGSIFKQQLKLRQSYLEIIGQSPSGLSVTIKIWVEVFHPVIHLEIEGDKEIQLESQFECWRNLEREFPYDGKRGSRWACFNLEGYPGRVVTYPDRVEFKEDRVIWWHRNRDHDLVFDKEVEQQGLTGVKEEMWNPLKNLTFGGLMMGKGLKPAGIESGCYAQTNFRGWKLKSQSARRNHHLKLILHTARAETLEDWQQELEELVRKTEGTKKSARKQHQQWWQRFWERSYICINPSHPGEDDPAWQVGRNYQLFRYMLACNAYGEYPTRFNGGNFTYDPCYTLYRDSYRPENEPPDYRAWGNSYTAQNQRHLYWPLLKSGDFEMMLPEFDFYRRALKNAELRTRVYWNHEGCSFTEQIENFGLPIGACYGWEGSYSGGRNRSADFEQGVQVSGACRYEFVHQLDFSYMILQYYRYSDREIACYLPFIKSSVKFFDKHYQFRHRQRTGERLDEKGNLVIYPSVGCESFHDAKNPTDVLAGLKAVIKGLLELPDEYLSSSEREEFSEILDRVPPIKISEKKGRRIIAPAESWNHKGNPREMPQLYSVFPFGLFALGKSDYQLARNTWRYGNQNEIQKTCYRSWYHGNIFTARLGFTEEAAEFAVKKLANSGRRFPSFWGPGDDWVPDHNWGGTGMVGLQEMLMQTEGKEIFLLPAWPKTWEVSFKLHAPYNTIVEGEFSDGEFKDLKVRPEGRREDVVIINKE